MIGKVESSADLILGKKTKVANKKLRKQKDETDTENGVGTKIIRKKAKKRELNSIEKSANETVEKIIKAKPSNKGKKRALSTTKTTEETKSEVIPKKKSKLSENEQHAFQRIKTKINKDTKNSTEYNANTIFVGNIPIDTTKKQLKAYFKKYGTIESLRIRGVPVAEVTTPKKVAAIKKEFHPDRKSLYAFIKFSNEDDAKKAEAENGQLFNNFHLRVHLCGSKNAHDESKAIFIGNLKFDTEEEELWKLFSSCGPISHVRIIRDGLTGIGKGFAYVNFHDTDSVFFALEMGEVSLRNRTLRISQCNLKRAKKNKKFKSAKQTNLPNLKLKRNRENGQSTNENYSKDKKPKASFAGRKFNLKNKNKRPSSFAIKKKKLAEKLMATNKKNIVTQNEN